MPKAYKPLTLDLIEEGEILRDFNAHFLYVQQALIQHAERWEDRAEKAKASITLTIELSATDPDDGVFSVVGKLSAKLPARPQSHSAAIADQSEDGPRLFCRASGTDEGDPRQAKFATRDGRMTTEEA